MTREEAKKIIIEEKLKHFNLYEERDLRENEVGIKFKNNQWIVYVTDERASVVSGSIAEFNFENDALDNFISRLRTEKI
jgi:hypothetical protein